MESTQFANGTGYGTIFAVRPLGSRRAGFERIVYRFAGNPDGSLPNGDLVAVGGMLYGTTYASGPGGYGTIFDVTGSGSLHVLHAFSGSPDGVGPQYRLLNLNGTLYGMTGGGGTSNHGSIYSLSL